jgi:hypothetical protein
MKTIILPIVLYVCETWSITLRDEHWLRVFENMVLMGTFEPKRDEVTGDLSKLHKEKLDVGGSCSTHGREERNVQGFSGKSRRKEATRNTEWTGQGPVAGCCECSNEPSGSCATELVSWNEKGMDLRETGCGNVEWIQLARNRGR